MFQKSNFFAQCTHVKSNYEKITFEVKRNRERLVVVSTNVIRSSSVAIGYTMLHVIGNCDKSLKVI